MNAKKYKLRYLPLFEYDLNEIVDYIAVHLKNPDAAERLVSDIESAIHERLNCPDSFEPYHSVKERRYPYYELHPIC